MDSIKLKKSDCIFMLTTLFKNYIINSNDPSFNLYDVNYIKYQNQTFKLQHYTIIDNKIITICRYYTFILLYDYNEQCFRFPYIDDMLSTFTNNTDTQILISDLNKNIKNLIFGKNVEYERKEILSNVFKNNILTLDFLYLIGMVIFNSNLKIFKLDFIISIIIILYRLLLCIGNYFYFKSFVYAVQPTKVTISDNQTISSIELTPGDIISLHIDDVVKADCEILEGKIVVEESNFKTTPSGVIKEKGDIVYSSSKILYDENCKAKVIRIGSRTLNEVYKQTILKSNIENRRFNREFKIIFGLILAISINFIGILFVLRKNTKTWKQFLFDNIGIIFMMNYFRFYFNNYFCYIRSEFYYNNIKNNIFSKNYQNILDIAKIKTVVFGNKGVITNKRPVIEGFQTYIQNTKLIYMSQVTTNTLWFTPSIGCYSGDDTEMALYKCLNYIIDDYYGTGNSLRRIIKIKKYKFEILKSFDFDLELKYQTSIVQDVKTKRYYICVKGKYNPILFKTNPCIDVDITLQLNKNKSVIVFGYREISESDYNNVMMNFSYRKNLELGIIITSIAIIDYELQPHIEETISILRKKYNVKYCTSKDIATFNATYYKLFTYAVDLKVMSGKELENLSENYNVNEIDVLYNATSVQKALFIKKLNNNAPTLFIGGKDNDLLAANSGRLGVMITSNNSVMSHYTLKDTNKILNLFLRGVTQLNIIKVRTEFLFQSSLLFTVAHMFSCIYGSDNGLSKKVRILFYFVILFMFRSALESNKSIKPNEFINMKQQKNLISILYKLCVKTMLTIGCFWIFNKYLTNKNTCKYIINITNIISVILFVNILFIKKQFFNIKSKLAYYHIPTMGIGFITSLLIICKCIKNIVNIGSITLVKEIILLFCSLNLIDIIVNY